MGISLLPCYWHLLSLDAPSVAALWAWSLARALHIRLSADSLLLLFAGTWLLYVADRVLDGLRYPAPRLRERHLFYIRHRAAALMAMVPAAALLGWLVFARMTPAARHADILIFAIAAAYFAIVHLRPAGTQRWFPKELIVALVFAAATAVPAAARLGAAHRGTLVTLSALFGALCWVNCIAIEKWEQGPRVARWPVHSTLKQDSQAQIKDATARWGQRRLRAVSLAIALASAIMLVIFLHSGQLAAAALALAATASAAFILVLDRAPLRAFHLRIAADAALLTPLLLVFFR